MKELLHKDVGLGIPLNVTESVLKAQEGLTRDNVTLSQHLSEHLAQKDKKHAYTKEKLLTVIDRLKHLPVAPFEVERTDNVITKYCIRTWFNDKKDISIVFRDNKIITAWLNYKSDSHTTLNKKNYN